MKILVTGSNGFIGKNLIAELRHLNYVDIYEYDIESTYEDLDYYVQHCEFIFHLAGVNRPKDQADFLKNNYGFTSILLDFLKKHKSKASIMLASSVQAALDNPYGVSKKAGEELLLDYSLQTGNKVLIYRFPNVFGKWCKPNYNSVIATFSNNIANNLPINVNDPNVVINLIYIDDLVHELVNALRGNENKRDKYCYVEPVYTVKLGEIVDLLHSFKESRDFLSVPNTSDPFTKKLYANYLSYLPKDQLLYDLKMNVDNRGSFTELIKTPDRGQVSINISKPGITKGNHWHHTKNEKFCVVYGIGIIRLRKVGEKDIIEFKVNGDKLQVIDIPPGYTHNIKNIGKTDMVTIMWVNEIFDQHKPDTIFMEV